MRAPAFWWEPVPSLAAQALRPAGAIWGAIAAARMDRPGRRAAVPVICIGNPVAGGAGKTPVAMAVAKLLQAHGHDPAFLSRGYGRDRSARKAVLRVDPDRHDALTCGDEPLLLARVAPTFVAADRLAAAAVAVEAGATVLVLDDGLQSPALRKDVGIAVVDGEVGIGNGLCLPAGPLRIPMARQWPHVSALCVVGSGAAGRTVAATAAAARIPVTFARLEPDVAVLASLRGRKLLAFAGIGRPQKFFDTLTRNGLAVAERRAFPDHHRFTAADLAALKARADRSGALLVTTAKDRVRLPPGFDAVAVPVDLVFDDPEALPTVLARIL